VTDPQEIRSYFDPQVAELFLRGKSVGLELRCPPQLRFQMAGLDDPTSVF